MFLRISNFTLHLEYLYFIYNSSLTISMYRLVYLWKVIGITFSKFWNQIDNGTINFCKPITKIFVLQILLRTWWKKPMNWEVLMWWLIKQHLRQDCLEFIHFALHFLLKQLSVCSSHALPVKAWLYAHNIKLLGPIVQNNWLITFRRCCKMAKWRGNFFDNCHRRFVKGCLPWWCHRTQWQCHVYTEDFWPSTICHWQHWY